MFGHGSFFFLFFLFFKGEGCEVAGFPLLQMPPWAPSPFINKQCVCAGNLYIDLPPSL